MKTLTIALIALLMASYVSATLNQALVPEKGDKKWFKSRDSKDSSNECESSGHSRSETCSDESRSKGDGKGHHGWKGKKHDKKDDDSCSDSSSDTSSWVSIDREEVRRHHEKKSSESCDDSWDKKDHKKDRHGKWDHDRKDGKKEWKKDDKKHWKKDDKSWKSDSSECSDSGSSLDWSDAKKFVKKGFLKKKLGKVWDEINKIEGQICDLEQKNCEQDAKICDLEARVTTLENAVFTGRTRPCDWECDVDPATGIIGISVHVDLCHLGLTETPVVLTSLVGEKKHRDTVGATSIYDLTNEGFTVRVRFADEEDAVTTELAEKWGWYIDYAVYNQDNAPQPEPCPEPECPPPEPPCEEPVEETPAQE